MFDNSGDESGGGWVAARRDGYKDFDLQSTPLEIWTDAEIGSGAGVNVRFYDSQGEWPGLVDSQSTT